MRALERENMPATSLETFDSETDIDARFQAALENKCKVRAADFAVHKRACARRSALACAVCV